MTTNELISKLKEADPKGKCEVSVGGFGIDLLGPPRKDGSQIVIAEIEIED